MSDGHLKKANYYRRRANELRHIAAALHADHYRETLLQCAQDYDRLAAEQERLAADCPSPEVQDVAR